MRNGPGLLRGDEIKMKIEKGTVMHNEGIYPPPVVEELDHIIVHLDAVELAALMSSVGRPTLVEEAQDQILEIKLRRSNGAGNP